MKKVNKRKDIADKINEMLEKETLIHSYYVEDVYFGYVPGVGVKLEVHFAVENVDGFERIMTKVNKGNTFKLEDFNPFYVCERFEYGKHARLCLVSDLGQFFTERQEERFERILLNLFN